MTCIPKEHFLGRAERLAKHWPFGDAEALLLVAGLQRKDTDDEHLAEGVWPQTSMMQMWLFSLEFPESVFVFKRSGQMIIWTREKKLKYFKDVQSPNMEYLCRSHPGSAEADAQQLEELFGMVKGGQDKPCVAVLDDVPLGPFAQAAVKRFAAPDVEVVQARPHIQDFLQMKDADEIEHLKRAAIFSCIAMQECIIKKWQDCVDDEEQITHAAFCSELEEMLEDESEVKALCNKNKLSSNEMDVPLVIIQSGKTFELDFQVRVNTEKLNVSSGGAHLLGITVRCAEYFAAITRTLVVNPTMFEKQAYAWMWHLHKKVVDLLKEGAVFQDIYREARYELGRLPGVKADLVKRFSRNVGWATGLAFREKGAILEEGCDRKVVVPSTFVVSVGLEADAEGRGAVWYSETVLVTGSKNEVLTSRCASSPKDAFFEVDMQEDAPPAIAAPPPPSAAAKPKPKAAAPKAAPGAASRQAPEPRERSRSRDKGKAKAAPKRAPKASPKAPAAPKASPKAAPKAPKATPEAKQKAKSKSEVKTPEVQKQPTPARGTARQQVATDAPVTRARRSMRSSTMRAKEAINEQAAMDRLQPPLRTAKLEEIRKRFEEGGAQAFGSKGPVVLKRLADYEAYKEVSDLPFRKNPQLRIDMQSEVLLVPYNGAIVPFHCKMIKNMNRQETDGEQHLRVNFFCPGQGKPADDFPKGNTKTVYVKELFFKSRNKDIFEEVIKDFKEVQKLSKSREAEDEIKAQHSEQAAKADALKEFRGGPCIRDVSMRPSMGSARSRPVWNLEAHHNGFRCGVRGSATEKLEVLYSQINVAIFQPCERRSLMVLIHFHLKEPIMIGRRKTFEIQFYTEVRAQTEDLSMRRSANAYDPDEILQEQREEEMKVRLNKVFQDFVIKTQKLPGFKMKFELPTEDFAISGVYHRANCPIFLCTKSIISVQEWPPLVIHMDDVEIAVFERVTAATREFDMVLIYKDYSRLPASITMIPAECMVDLKTFFGDLKMVWYILPMNMQWKPVMQEITGDLAAFVNNGGFQAWFDTEESEDEDDAAKEEDGSDFEASEDDMDGDEEMDSDEEPSEEEESSDDESDDDDDDDSEFEEEEDDEGKSWDELEREAEEEDRRRSGAARGKAKAAPKAPTRNTKRR